MKKIKLLGCLAAMALILSSCQPENAGSEPAGTSKAEETIESAKAENPSEEAHIDSQAGKEEAPEGLEIKAAKNIGAENQLFTERYFKAGEYGSEIFFYPSQEGLESDDLECTFHTGDDAYFRVFSQTGKSGILTKSNTASYEILVEQYAGAELAAADPYQITFHLNDAGNRHISVDGGGSLAGDYYPFSESFVCPDVFTRYLSKADLWSWPTEDLWLLRNQVYAAHGRRFSSDVLNDYFAKQMWYRGHIEPEDFSESVLSAVEKKNIALIQDLENQPFSERNKMDGGQLYDLESLPSAPYLSYLGIHRETGLHADLTTAEDMGAYYQVQGSISFPASITHEQMDTVVGGGKVHVVLNELTGESWILERDRGAADLNTAYGYFLYQEGTVPSEGGMETGLSLDISTGTWQLWQASADTVMKTVYSGDIYIMKGAVEGFDTGIEGASKNQKEIVPPGIGREREESASDRIVGNCLRYNEKGHFTAVYYLGD